MTAENQYLVLCRECLIELVVALIAYCMTYLPRTRRPLRSRHGSGARQKGTNVLLSYSASCFREVVHDSQIVALYVACFAWAPTLYTSQAWIVLSFLYIVAINGARMEVHSALFDVLSCQFSHLEGSPI